jgi:SAM-dependent methyltransferase
MYNGAAVVDFDRFAKYYDLDYGTFREDVDLYLSFAGRTGSPILEIGCGTGRLLVPLAEAGFEVTGIDISPAMLAIAARKVAAAGLASRVHLVPADVRDFRLPGRFALAFVALNSFMHFVELAEQLRVLERIAVHLAPDGLLILDLFNPDPDLLTHGHGVLTLDYVRTDPTTRHVVSRSSANHVDVANQRIDVTFIYDEVAPDGTVNRTLAPFPIHYFWRRELELLLDRAGYQIERIYGSYDLEESAAGSERLIVVATRPGSE